MSTRTPRHPAYVGVIHKLLHHAPRKGMSLQAIRKAVQQKYSLPDSCRRGIRLAVHRALKSGLITHGSSSQMYKLSKRFAKQRTLRRSVAKAPRWMLKKSATPKKAVKKASSPAASPAGSPAPSPKKVSVKKSAASPKKAAPKKIARFTKTHIWQYVDNSGKYADYDAPASDAVEEAYEEYQKNPHMMDVRAVRSGDWQYQVDFVQMKQTNIVHENHRVRTIRRIPNPYL